MQNNFFFISGDKTQFVYKHSIFWEKKEKKKESRYIQVIDRTNANEAKN